MTPPRSLGWSLYENSAMDGTIAGGATNDYVWLAGDFAKGYRIHDRVGTMIELIPTLFKGCVPSERSARFPHALANGWKGDHP
jgi:predicted phage gp36 major capsid-like protein